MNCDFFHVGFSTVLVLSLGFCISGVYPKIIFQVNVACLYVSRCNTLKKCLEFCSKTHPYERPRQLCVLKSRVLCNSQKRCVSKNRNNKAKKLILPRSSRVVPLNRYNPKKESKDRLPSFIFQGWAVKLWGCNLELPHPVTVTTRIMNHF